MAKKLFDITYVCKMFGITSRTLRFYEEKGIIDSTTEGVSLRRQYTDKQIDKIRCVLVLRTLGLSIKAISELQKKDGDLRQAVITKRAEIYSLMDTKFKEIRLLNEALSVIDSGDSIFDVNLSEAVNTSNDIYNDIARTCAKAVIEGDTDTLYFYIGNQLEEYMPREVYEKVRTDTFAPLGEFVSYELLAEDKQYPNVIYQYVRFTNYGLKIKFVFNNRKIYGLWFAYYDCTE